MKRGRETKPCDNIPDRPSNSIPMPKVKEPKKEGEGITIDVDCSRLDEALEKARELIEVLQRIDGLTGTIARDIDRINKYTLGK